MYGTLLITLMRVVRCVLLLSLLISGCDSRTDKDKKPSDKKTSIRAASLFPCWEQFWDCDDWHPLTHELDHTQYIEVYTPNHVCLLQSMCERCQSFLLIDPDMRKERVVLSAKGRAGNCEHRWISAVHKWTFDNIMEGDIVVIICDKQMHVLSIEKLSLSGLDQELFYRIAQVTDAGQFRTEIDLGKLIWRSKSASRNVPVGARKIEFFITMLHPDGAERCMAIDYDHFYGKTRNDVMSEKGLAHIAIIHRADYNNDSVIDLTQFRFKTWEDGLGNKCDSADD